MVQVARGIGKALGATLFVLVFFSCAATPSFARQPSAVEWQFITAVQQGDVAKARALMQLAHINPDNVAGRPIISYAAQTVVGVHMISDNMWNYLLGELKQDVNSRYQDQERTIFSTLCENMAATPRGMAEPEMFKHTAYRILDSLQHGASPKELPGAPPYLHPAQPLWTCVREYRGNHANAMYKGLLLSIIGAFLDKGADPNYTALFLGTPTSEAVEFFDSDLLKLMVAHGGRMGRVYFAATRPCPTHPPAKNTILSFLPDPKDSDTAAARAFLTDAIALGADIKAKQTRTWLDGQCRREDVTLKENALNRGQIAYAKMVMDLEALPVDVARAHAETSPAPSPPTAAPGQSATQMAYVLLGAHSLRPMTQHHDFTAPDGVLVEKKATTFTPVYRDTCRLNLKIDNHSDYPLTNTAHDFHGIIAIDFTKVVKLLITPALAPFSDVGGPRHATPNPAAVRPRVTLLTLVGDGAACYFANNGASRGCATARKPYILQQDGPVSSAAITKAFRDLKNRCPSAGKKASAAPAPLAACPGRVKFVEVESHAGQYKPPAFLSPDWDNGRTNDDLQAKWNNVLGQDIALHCKLMPATGTPPGAPLKEVVVKVPANANTCALAHNRMNCFAGTNAP